jgi:outer membrane protein assembly factor BamD (BamD/ComL family)
MKYGIKLAGLSLAVTSGLLLGSLAVPARAQGVSRGPISTPRDPELEKQCAHSLEVARYYFYKRKPQKGDVDGQERLNKGVEGRLLEILDTNPNFGKVDEVYFMLGELYLRWNNPDEATKNYSRVVKDYPDSDFVGNARKRLAEIESKVKVKKEG